MSDSRNNDYDEFFKNQAGSEEAHDDGGSGETQTGSDSQSKPSYYYSYGPFKSGSNGLTGNDGRYSSVRSEGGPSGSPAGGEPQPAAQSQGIGNDDAVYAGEERQAASSAPVQLRSITPNPNYNRGGWQVREPKRKSSFRSIFASFLAGVVLVGALMWASDFYNWFGGANTALSGASTSANSEKATGTSSTNASAVAARPDNLAQLFETASPAVVKITTYVNASNRQGSSLLDDPFFRQFFGVPDSSQEQEKGGDSQLQESGVGTGFFFESSGYILTNQHVVGDSDKIEVTVQGYDEPFTAELLGSDFDLDLAVLKITGDKAFPTLPLGSSDDINIGDWVVAIGNPYGFDHTITAGVLSAKERPITIQDTDGTRNYKHLLQTDASINPGNSGGPLLNTEGEVIGINTAVSTEAQGIGFAIPTSTITEVLEDLKNGKEVEKEPVPFIGATLGDVTEEIAKQLGMDKAEGSIVTAITFNSPAYKADLRQYDVILGIDGKTFDSTSDLITEIQKHKVGDTITLNILRNGNKTDLKVEIGDKNKFNVE
ncbi:S1C family serine protease [Paenibacillus thailandensis]|uniref:S1C family serine protease n=1 Tax=Paenibacillus thailandensis TaxID=393250 RepID=A0ABW5QRZ6_9BACL